EKMSLAQRGRRVSSEARARIAASLTGRKASPGTIAKRSQKLRGQRRSLETKMNLKLAQLKRSGTNSLRAFNRSQHLVDWAREFGIHHATLRNRLYRSGLSLEEALTRDKH